MVTIGALIIPVLLSAVLVFILSALVWMALPHHRTDFRPLPSEDAVRAAIGSQNVGPGQYSFPWAMGGAAMKDPVVQKKFQEGPNGILTIVPAGRMGMGPQLVQSFIYYLAVSLIVAYLAGRTLAPGAEYLQVFRVVGTATWLGYGFGVITDSIWFGKPWSSTIKHLLDALLYAVVTAGVFGWRWPG